MADDNPHSALFLSVSRELLSAGLAFRFQAHGFSMQPTIRDGDILHVKPIDDADELRKGDIVLFNDGTNHRAHRLVNVDRHRGLLQTRGDAGAEADAPVSAERVLGKVVAKEQSRNHYTRVVSLSGKRARLNFLLGNARRTVARSVRRTLNNYLWIALLFCLVATLASAQVAVDTTTSTNARVTGTAATVTFAHTTGAGGVNRLLVVGVSLNITNSTSTHVTAVTYNGIALTLIGAHNDAADSERVELWRLLAPATGNHNVVVTVNTAGVTVGLVAGATTFTGVDQTTPVGALVSADGAADTFSAVDVPSNVNGVVLDALAVNGLETVTVGNSQTQQWNRRSGTVTATDVRGVGSTRDGAPSVPLSETFSGASNWSLEAISLNPLQADLSITNTGSSAFFPQNLTFSLTVTNNGTSPATGVTVTNPLPAGLTFVSAMSSQGTCTGTTTVTCNLGSLAVSATATITITGTPTARGGYPDTATVTGAVTDLNTGNNSANTVSFSQSNSCSMPGNNGMGGMLTGTINTYYPATANAAAGAKSIALGAATGSTTPIAIGDLLLVIQMQDTTINSTNTLAYGDGSSGSGFTALNTTGLFEFVTATNAVPLTGGTVNFTASGISGGLLYSYLNAAATATMGQEKYQVVRVPQYSTATLTSGLTATAWNGSSGGILALDVAGTLTLGSATVSVDGKGFRGGAGLQMNGGTGANTDFRLNAPTTYMGTTVAGTGGAKGEGIAGTPRWVESGTTFLGTGVEGYPNGSMGRGAPGNGGGGGTDGDPGGNDENAGGGGGGNGGSGGAGGDSWNSNVSSGGLGGGAIPASVTRIAPGGGGGAGTRNNSNGDNQASSGSAGGGIVIIRAGTLSGTATISANGTAAYNGTANDAGGGGGAGGSIIIISDTGGESGLTLAAHGGRGGDAWNFQPFSLADRHGPGGGGGGGVVLVSGPPAGIDVTGGTDGLTLNPGVAYGSTPGDDGISATNVSLLSLPGNQSGAACTSDVAIAKSHTGTFTRGGTNTYTITVSNVSPSMATSGLVTMSDTLPTGLTPTAASGTGWTCGVSASTVTCTRSDALAASSSYPAITVTVTVSQTAPNQVTNTATVSGGSELNTLNDTASDVTDIASNADLSITKTASPNPVKQGATITYTLTVTNNGPTNATGVTVTDTLPTQVTYISATPSQGTCSQSGGVVTCNLGSMASGAVATITILATAGSPSQAVNTATVTGDQPDSNLPNNTATQTETITFGTSVKLETFTATADAGQVVLRWKTGREAHNLGFNVYREQNGNRVRLNPSIIAGSALTFRATLPQHAAKSYSWIDRGANAAALYWLEDVDISGARTWNGPVTAGTGVGVSTASDSLTLSQLHVDATSSDAWSSHFVQSTSLPLNEDENHRQPVQYHLAANPAVKIAVDHEGWYRVTQPQLVANGLDPSVDPRLLKLYAQGIEQPLRITGATEGSGGFGPDAAIEFYGVGLDTPASDRRIYWLAAGDGPGKRIEQFTAASEDGQQPLGFSETAELRQRTTYFAALLTTKGDNFFGALVSSTPVDQTLRLPDIATASTDSAMLDVVLQGVSDGEHNVSVALNGATIGAITFNSQDEGESSWPVPLSQLLQGENTVTLTSEAGDSDTSLVNFIKIKYPRKYDALNDSLKFTAPAGDHVVVKGFQTTPTRVIDVTDPLAPVAVNFQVESVGNAFALEAKVPWSASGTHRLIALSDDKLATPVALEANQPSHWHAQLPGWDIVVISHSKFIHQLDPLVQLHRKQGKSVVVIDVDDIYDEFNFGEPSPFAVKDFLQLASNRWQKQPKYLLLVGDASLDPRNYLGFGYFDFVPTRIVPTSELKTASDDWFTDFHDTGFAQIPTGRLPVRTVEDAQTVIGKILAYQNSEGGDWSRQALMVADQNDPNLDFTQEAMSVQALLPKSLNVTDVFAQNLDATTARQEILDGINAGKLLVNYNGHGSTEVWSGEDLFDDTSAAGLTNGNNLPVFLIMNCLNGFFQDVYTESLAETLLLNPNGGAVAVWASSALTDADPQVRMDQTVVKALFGTGAMTLGDAIALAKSGIVDTEVRHTFVLFGDPAMMLKRP